MGQQSIRIVDVDETNLDRYLVCLVKEQELAEVVGLKRAWYEKLKLRGLLVKIAIDDAGHTVGMIQVVPIEESGVLGDELLFVNCIWIPPTKRNEGGKTRGQGIGRLLLQEIETVAIQQGKKGVVAWGVCLPIFMKAAWFRRQGYQTVAKRGIMRLLYKPFVQGHPLPTWPSPLIPQRSNGLGPLPVTLLHNGWCPAMNMVTQHARRILEEYGAQVKVTEIDTSEKKALYHWGEGDAIYLDDQSLFKGPPPSETKIRRRIKRALARRKE